MLSLYIYPCAYTCHSSTPGFRIVKIERGKARLYRLPNNILRETGQRPESDPGGP